MAVKYLDLTGLGQYDTKIKKYIGATILPLTDNGSTTAGTWLATNSQVTALVDGQMFIYKVVIAGASTTTLKINNLTAKNVYRYGTTKLTTQYGVGQYLLLIYNSTNDCFRVMNDYDANSYAYVRQYQAGQNVAGTGTKYPILTRYNLTNKNGTYDTAYSRFHTDTYIDTSNGYLYAPKLYSGGNEVLTGITSSEVTTALGYTPYNSTNPNGYTSNVGTVTKVNNTSPDANGNVSLTLPPTITINTTNKTISDGTNTLTFGSNAFTNTQIPSSYVASSTFNSSTKKLTITSNSGLATEVTFGSNAFNSTTIPTSYVSSVNGSTGAITNVAKTDSANTFTTAQTINSSSGNTCLTLKSAGSVACYITYRNSSNTYLGGIGVLKNNSTGNVARPVFDDGTIHQIAYKSEISSGTVLFKHTLTDESTGNVWVIITDDETSIEYDSMKLYWRFYGTYISAMVCWYDGDGYRWYNAEIQATDSYAPYGSVPSEITYFSNLKILGRNTYVYMDVENFGEIITEL